MLVLNSDSPSPHGIGASENRTSLVDPMDRSIPPIEQEGSRGFDESDFSRDKVAGDEDLNATNDLSPFCDRRFRHPSRNHSAEEHGSLVAPKET
jgi:hypothetical protein